MAAVPMFAEGFTVVGDERHDSAVQQLALLELGQ